MVKYKFFTREEEVALFIRWRETNCEESFHALVLSQMAWAKKLASRYVFDEHNALSLAHIACIDAVSRHDPTRGRLTATIKWAVLSAMRCVPNDGPIKLPVLLRAPAPKWTSFDYDKFDEPAQPAEAKADYDINEMRRFMRHVIAAKILSHRELWVIWKVYWEDWTLEEMGAALHLSRERVRQVRNEALGKLRNELLNQHKRFDVSNDV